MIVKKISLFFAAGIIAILALSAFGQDLTFSDPNVDYSFTVPDAKWKLTVKPSATNPNVEYVSGDRQEGLLEVRKLTVAKGSLMTDIIRDEEQKLQFRPGYVAGKEENFTGNLRGNVFNFEYVTNGKNMSGRFYFLKASDTTIYLLRFTGLQDKLRGLRNQTDSIARTFVVKH